MNTPQTQSPNDIASKTLVLILAGGRGSRLHEMTDQRAKPAVYFGGNWRIIDFTLSNCLNSNLLRIGVITQYEAHSLLRHLQHAWSFLPRERGQFVDMLPARQQMGEDMWYRGTADAVWQNLPIMKEHYRPKYVLILAGDHIYKMDYMKMIQEHIQSGARCTVGSIEVKKEEAREFGIMAVNDKLQVQAFVEKPQDPPTMREKPDTSMASMGIYVFDFDYLTHVLEDEINKGEKKDLDFGKHLMPRAMHEGVLYAHPFEKSCKGRTNEGVAYWRDVGTLDSYWQTHMDLVTAQPHLNLFDRDWAIRGLPTQSMPTKFFNDERGKHLLDNSLIAGGCLITNATITESVLFDNIEVKDGSSIHQAVILPDVQIGKNCRLQNCIVERKCQIPDGMVIGMDKEHDKARGFRVSSSGKVTLITPTILEKWAESERAQSQQEPMI
ncbi:glucose-1-phosphate adenylyltransferase [Alysiella filiformis]|uniref:Glucose-1-phosphate adenylyltransferase n=1 Tax=Alysiella filiformis DSM 16848 TaxID=1120981 RepID=A0A286E9I3_9NEIS|nr:glucose-1-phosphate adenylyltransferase [Alysiella filiformis]QMT31426.1 glucose-1-phosphate adenylyltransferase [Alysiella filiformis]UBQ55565.1 glucose-1-phosphate adenylyltransferase [Alysiella filiformis DSM 16848]SOD67514.1 glucose-1-phosphate adenylyltransferase [Alysiella filiformis DSM 16848]